MAGTFRKFTRDEFVALAVNKKIPMLVRHGVAAVYEGTYRVIKRDRNGKPIRTSQRRKVRERWVGRGAEALLEAFNNICDVFQKYGYIHIVGNTIILTAEGSKRNRLHLRETDTRRRTRLFAIYFERLFKNDINNYNKNKDE